MDLLLSLYEDERVQLAQSTRHRRAPFGRSSPARGSRSWVGLFSCVRTWSRDTYGVARSATHKNNSPRTADGGLKEGRGRLGSHSQSVRSHSSIEFSGIAWDCVLEKLREG